MAKKINNDLYIHLQAYDKHRKQDAWRVRIRHNKELPKIYKDFPFHNAIEKESQLKAARRFRNKILKEHDKMYLLTVERAHGGRLPSSDFAYISKLNSKWCPEGYKVKIRKLPNRPGIQKYFTIDKHGSDKKALAAAIDFRDAFLIEYGLEDILKHETRGRPKREGEKKKTVKKAAKKKRGN